MAKIKKLKLGTELYDIEPTNTVPLSDVAVTSVAGKKGDVTLSNSDVGLGNVGNFKAVSTAASQGLTSTEQSNARANIGAGTSSLTLGTTATTAAKGNHTHTTTIAASSGTNELTLAHGSKYAITAGGQSFVFTMPADNNTTYTFNGAVSTIKDSNLTASRALISNSSGKVAVSDVTLTELSYLDGVTSNIQTQLNGKAASSHGTHVTKDTVKSALGAELITNISDGPNTLTITKGDGSTTTLNTTQVFSPLTAADGNVQHFVNSNMAVLGSLNEGQVTYDPATRTISNNKGALNITGNAATANTASKADEATKATNDGVGNNIRDTYALKDHGTHVTAATVKSALGTSTGTSKYLREDGTWVTPPNSNTDAIYSGIAYCTTAASTAAKVATMPKFALASGQYILLRTTIANTATSSVTLNVNSTGAKTIKIGSAAVTASNFPAGDYLAKYDGTNWVLTRVYLTDNNTTYGAGSGINVSNGLISNTGVRSIATGSTNGTISVNTNGTSAEVAVKGLGSAAYTASTAYAAASHGTHVTADTVKSALGTSSTGTGFLKQDGTWATPANTTYSLVGANGTTGLVKNGSSVTSTSGLTACPIISGVPYYKDTNTQSAYGNITTSGTITSTAVTSATGVLVYDSNNKIQRATAANLRTIIGAGTSNLAIGTTSTTAAAGNHTHDYSSTYAAKSHTHSDYASKATVDELSDELSSHTHSGYATSGHDHSGTYQPLDADLTAIAGLTGAAGVLRKTNTNTWSLDTSTYLTSSSSIQAQQINAMTGYSKPSSTSAISASDSLNSAIGKLEKALDSKGTSNLALGGNGSATTAAKSDHTHDNYITGLEVEEMIGSYDSSISSVYAPYSHTHNYAGSSSAGGAANSVKTSLTFNNGGSGAASGTTFNGSTARTISYNTIGAAPATHGHIYSFTSYSEIGALKYDITAGNITSTSCWIAGNVSNIYCFGHVAKTGTNSYILFLWMGDVLYRSTYNGSSWTDDKRTYTQTNKLPSFSLSGTVLTITDNN